MCRKPDWAHIAWHSSDWALQGRYLPRQYLRVRMQTVHHLEHTCSALGQHSSDFHLRGKQGWGGGGRLGGGGGICRFRVPRISLNVSCTYLVDHETASIDVTGNMQPNDAH